MQPSQAQQCHPHPRTRHSGETHAPRAFLSTDPVVTLLSPREPIFPSRPSNSLLCVNTTIQTGPMKQRSCLQLDLFPHPTLPPTTAHKCSSWQHRPQRFCWIKAITWHRASHRSSTKTATKSRTPLTLHHRRASSASHCEMGLQAHTPFCQLSSHGAQWWVETDCTGSEKEERAFLTCSNTGDRLVLWLDWDFVHLGFCFAYMANCPFPRAAQVLSSPASFEFVFLVFSH